MAVVTSSAKDRQPARPAAAKPKWRNLPRSQTAGEPPGRAGRPMGAGGDLQDCRTPATVPHSNSVRAAIAEALMAAGKPA
ncbi:hypothetical protein GCM10009733_102500 [Nonomuraea maheshkhaliensis]|uniref:Uncharacterized protein n=1 Tax=Nonomuraea maheshkhaliensis TaxID=419590 RepID=A0ABN2HKU9_9ACTN